MNSVEVLQNEYGVTTVWKDNRPHFTTPSKELISTVCGGEPDNRLWALMRDIDTNWKRYKPPEDKRIIVDLPRQKLVLTREEILKCVSANEEIYMEALKRGKSELRYLANERRQKYEQDKENKRDSRQILWRD